MYKDFAQTLHVGYKLGYYTQPNNGRIREVLIELEILTTSQIKDNRMNEIYDYMKTDLARVRSIKNLTEDEITNAYLTRKLQHEISVGDIIRFKNPKFEEIVPDTSYIAYYTTKTGALNYVTEVGPNYTGDKMRHYRNGKIKEKHYYVNGFKTHTFGYYNNDFNSLHYTWKFTQLSGQTFPEVREYIYNQQENPIAQFLISEGRITKKTIYDKTNYIKSFYLRSY